jgi:hypothetical protein
MIAPQIAYDPEKPDSGGRWFAQVFSPAPGAKECLLSQILGQVRIARQTQGKAVHTGNELFQ